ncbi:hypothetical protein N752_28830 [Desulforamulus aquiferis]|nr:hypothetical protein N752_28830 [Desulforamulus aquiferis]
MGADHTAGYSVTHNVLKVGGHIDPLVKEGNIKLSRDLQIATAAIDSAGLCLFVAFSLLDKPEVYQAMIDLIDARIGPNTTEDDIIELGKYVLGVERKFNEAAGINKAADRLPEFFEEPVPPHNVAWDFTGEELDEVFNFVDGEKKELQYC